VDWHWAICELIGINRNGRAFLTRSTFVARRGEWWHQLLFKVGAMWGVFWVALLFLADH